jgi:hypothetical protein
LQQLKQLKLQHCLILLILRMIIIPAPIPAPIPTRAAAAIPRAFIMLLRVDPLFF